MAIDEAMVVGLLGGYVTVSPDRGGSQARLSLTQEGRGEGKQKAKQVTGRQKTKKKGVYDRYCQRGQSGSPNVNPVSVDAEGRMPEALARLEGLVR